jgi:putative ABC transport system substrate-binding protein
MNRRHFISLVGGAAALPIAARAQQAALPRVGYLSSGSPELYADRLRAFLQGLNDTGFLQGRNVAIEYRWSSGRDDLLPALALDLVRSRTAVIVVGGSAAIKAAMAATATIPIVFYAATDPFAGINRPVGNITGVIGLDVETGPNREVGVYAGRILRGAKPQDLPVQQSN